MKDLWEFALDYKPELGPIITPRVFDAAGNLPDVDFANMTAEEIYNELYARARPLDAIVKAMEDEE